MCKGLSYGLRGCDVPGPNFEGGETQCSDNIIPLFPVNRGTDRLSQAFPPHSNYFSVKLPQLCLWRSRSLVMNDQIFCGLTCLSSESLQEVAVTCHPKSISGLPFPHTQNSLHNNRSVDRLSSTSGSLNIWQHRGQEAHSYLPDISFISLIHQAKRRPVALQAGGRRQRKAAVFSETLLRPDTWCSSIALLC